MQRFERSKEPPPQILQGNEAAGNRQVLRDYFGYAADKRAQTSVPRQVLPLEHPTIREALTRLFHGKCAFCEASETLLPYRFRPPFEALPIGKEDQVHLYYSWLADAWENIYAICRTCRPERPEFFPVKGRRARLPTLQEMDGYVRENLGLWRNYPPQEVPLLLDPCEQANFSQSLHVRSDGWLEPRTDRATATIEAFNLNRTTRVMGRSRKHQEYFAALSEGLFAPAGVSEEVPPKVSDPFDFANLEYGGTWYLLLRRLALVLGGGGGSRPIISPSRIERFYLRFRGQTNANLRFQQALTRLQEDDVAGDPPLTGDLANGLLARASRIRASRSRARLTRIELHNFKSIENLELDMPQEKGTPVSPEDSIGLETSVGLETRGSAPSLLILGENAAGKSSVLEAIALALSDAAARIELSLEVPALVLDPSYLGNPTGSRPRDGAVTLRFDNGGWCTLRVADDGYHMTADPQFETLPVFAYGAFRHYRDRQRNHSPAKYVKTLFHSDILLSNPERWLLGLEEASFQMVVRALREILSIEGEFEVIEPDPIRARCMIVSAIPGASGTVLYGRTPLSVASSGYRAVLAMVCDIIQGLMDPRVHDDFETLTAARAVVLIDEVEAHLHPRWKMQIMRGLRRALPNVTFIATTHDPLCLRGMEDGEVLVLQRVANQQSKTPTQLPVFVESLIDLPKISQLTVEQLLTSDLFQLFSTDTPEMDGTLATVADVLAKRRGNAPLSLQEAELLASFEADIAAALPVGASEAQRLVQEAVADFLKERRTASEARLGQLRATSKVRIVQALRDI